MEIPVVRHICRTSKVVPALRYEVETKLARRGSGGRRAGTVVSHGHPGMMTRQTQRYGCGRVLQIGHRKYAYDHAICAGGIIRGEIRLNRMMTMQMCSHADEANPALRRG